MTMTAKVTLTMLTMEGTVLIDGELGWRWGWRWMTAGDLAAENAPCCAASRGG